MNRNLYFFQGLRCLDRLNTKTTGNVESEIILSNLRTTIGIISVTSVSIFLNNRE